MRNQERFNRKWLNATIASIVLLAISMISVGGLILQVTLGITGFIWNTTDAIEMIVGGTILLFCGIKWIQIKNDRKWYEDIKKE